MSSAHKPLRPGARVFWTLTTLAAFAYLIHSYAAYLAG